MAIKNSPSQLNIKVQDNKTPRKISLRPHHYLCSFCFQGKGYSPHFIDNFHKIINQLNEDKDYIYLKTVDQSDAICAPCPHRRGKRCQTEAKIKQLDQLHQQALDIAMGDEFTWQQIRQRIREKINLAVFESICKSCSWQTLGICRQTIANINSNQTKPQTIKTLG